MREAIGGKVLNSCRGSIALKHGRRHPSPEPPRFASPTHRRLVLKAVPMRERHTLFGVWRELWGPGECFRTGSRLVPRRKTARGSLFLNQGRARPEPSTFHVGVTTPYRRDGPAASIPQAIGYLSPFRQTETRQASSKRQLLYRRMQWIHDPALEDEWPNLCGGAASGVTLVPLLL